MTDRMITHKEMNPGTTRPTAPPPHGRKPTSSDPMEALVNQMALLTMAMQDQNQLMMKLIDQNNAMLDMLMQDADESGDDTAKPQYLNG